MRRCFSDIRACCQSFTRQAFHEADKSLVPRLLSLEKPSSILLSFSALDAVSVPGRRFRPLIILLYLKLAVTLILMFYPISSIHELSPRNS